MNAALDIVARYNRFKKPQNVSNTLRRAANGRRVGFSNSITVRQRSKNTRVGSTNETSPNVILSEANLEKTRISGLKSKGRTNFKTRLPPNEKESLRKAMEPNFSEEYINTGLHNGPYTYNDKREELTAKEMARLMLEEAGEV